jgi:hypothetical protein
VFAAGTTGAAGKRSADPSAGAKTAAAAAAAAAQAGAAARDGGTAKTPRKPRKTVPVKRARPTPPAGQPGQPGRPAYGGGTGQQATSGRSQPGQPPRAAGPGRPAARPGRGGQQFDTGEQLLPWADRWTDAADAPADPLEATGPFPLTIPPEQPPAEQSRFVILAVGAVVVVVLLVAVLSVRDLFSSDGEGASGARDRSASAPSAGASSPAASAAPSVQPTTPAPSAAAPQIAAIRALDPEGDGDEDTRRSPRAVDGDPATTWRSQTYRSATFGGLKEGVGLSLRLERPAVLTGVQLDVKGTGGHVEVKVGATPDVAAATTVASSDLASGQTAITARGATPAQYVILWFTSLPETGGKYRIEVSEVRVT